VRVSFKSQAKCIVHSAGPLICCKQACKTAYPSSSTIKLETLDLDEEVAGTSLAVRVEHGEAGDARESSD
jgi:hypothetical protein